jgi:Ice-binding-like
MTWGINGAGPVLVPPLGPPASPNSPMVGQQGNAYPPLFNASFESWMAAVSRGEVSLNVRVANSDQFGGLNNGPPGSIISAGNPTLMQALSQGMPQNGTNGLNGVGASGGTVNSGSGSTNTDPGTFQSTSMGGTQTIDAKQMVSFNFGSSSSSNSPTALNLGANASTMVVLAGSTITNTGSSVLTGNLGLSPGTSVTGFPPGIVNGVQHITDGFAATAQTDLTTAFVAGNALTPTATLVSPGDLGGRTLPPGVYSAASSIGITGTVTLDAQGNPNAVWVFQIGSTLTTAVGNSNVALINGAQASNVFWVVGSSATLTGTSTFAGNILAQTSISVGGSVNLSGRLLARSGAVTLITDTLSVPSSASGPGNFSSNTLSSPLQYGGN